MQSGEILNYIFATIGILWAGWVSSTLIKLNTKIEVILKLEKKDCKNEAFD